MANGYTRQSAADIVDNAVINASDFNAEFNQLQTAFNNTAGHSHDGTTTGSGGQIAAANISGLGTISAQNSNSVVITGGSITGLPTPTNATDAATKAYVDSSPSTFVQFKTGFMFKNGNSGSATTTSWFINPGLIVDANGNVYKCPALTRTISAVWGTGNGGMGTGLTVAANTWYDAYAIVVTSTGLADVYFDLANSVAHRPTGTTLATRIGSFLTNGSSLALSLQQVGQRFYWSAPVVAFNGTSVPSSATNLNLATLGAAPPHTVFPIFSPLVFTGGTAGLQTYTITGIGGGTLVTPPTYQLLVNGTNSAGGGTDVLPTTAAGIIQHASSSTTNTVQLTVAGWVDPSLSPFSVDTSNPLV